MMTHRRLLLLLLCLLCCDRSAADRPNLLWITAEDMSPALGCYGDSYAVTPAIDRLAAESVRYTRMFATAPVCSPVRFTLLTGRYAPSCGTHNMRSAISIPNHVRGFPAYLREAGYYTTNNAKTDYNTSAAERLIQESWDSSSETAHWRQRPDTSQPFFSVFNLMTTHQSRTMVWPREKFVAEIQSRLPPDRIHDPDTAPLPPYYPDTPVIRREWARFHDCVSAMDQEVEHILQQLQEDGLADNTIVFFFSDHGSGMPRHKRLLLDTGLHVPLLIRFPKKWNHLAAAAPGRTSDRLLSFVDLPPTVLRLAGLPLPDYLQGQPFLRSDAAERAFAFGHRDRVDEAFDCARSVRSRQYLYIRNYMPDLSYHQPTAWPDQGEIRHEFYRLADRTKLTAAQWQYVSPTRPAEELYDCDADPLNLHNLAAREDDNARLLNMRRALKTHLEDTDDLGFIPEALLIDAMRHRRFYEQDSTNDIARYYRSQAQHVGLQPADFFLDQPPDYWNAVGLRVAGYSSEAESQVQRLWPLDPDWSSEREIVNNVEAAHTLLVHGDDPRALAVLIRATTHDNLNIVLQAVRTIELLGKAAQPAIPAIRDVVRRCGRILPTATTATFVQSAEQDLAMFISFSANAFLSEHDKSM